MTSIIARRANDSYNYHSCGGTILSGPDHVYCDGCDAVVYYGGDCDCADYDESMRALLAGYAYASAVNRLESA